MARICLLLSMVMLCGTGSIQAQTAAGKGPTIWVSQGSPVMSGDGVISHNVPPQANVHASTHTVVPGCQNCAAHGRGGCHRHIDLRRLWEWATYCPIRSGHACSGKTCEPMCRPGLYEYFLPCAGGHPPRLPGCASCAKHH